MENDEELKPCPFCGGEVEIVMSGGDRRVDCKTCGARSDWYDTEAEAIDKWNNRVDSNYPEKQDSSKELMDFVKFCRNASVLDIVQIHDRARDLIAKSKKCCEKSCKEENATLKPLIPKWKIRGDAQELVLNLSQKAKLEFIINTEILNVMSYIVDDDIAISCKEVGTFDTLKDAKTKVNECIKDLGEMLVYFAENIKTERSGE